MTSDAIAVLRAEALRLFSHAIKAADPAPALARQFAKNPITPTDGTIYVIAVGKAACPMLRETLKHVPKETKVKALAITNKENFQLIEGATVLPAGHPVPDVDGETAGKAVINLLSNTRENDRVIALISGGGSALLPAPIDGITLADKARVSTLLLGAGCDIESMNEVRQQLSKLKGGGMLRLAAPAPVDAFILSDVIGDDLRAIASGPTVAPLGSHATAKKILETYNVYDQMPPRVKAHLETPNVNSDDLPKANNTLICSNRQSLDAMQLNSKFAAKIMNDRLVGNVADVGPALVSLVNEIPADKPVALIFGGETTVTLKGTGMGGRNQDLALRFALNAHALKGDWVFMSGGTDGRDGPTDAAGGLVDPRTIERIKNAGHDPENMLENNDAYSALRESNDLIIIGGTGTNVADVQIFLRA
ncbi:MAG: DUF4147 domain-containing protein [Litoreibacter sp.]